MLVITLGVVLAPTWAGVTRKATIMGGISGVVLSILIVVLIVFTNLRIIQADIVFKLAEPFTRTGQWPVAITIYNRANQLAPNEDYYYLFLGRAYLEQAKTLSEQNDRENLIRQAESDLRRSQSINPLNTDHTANLARLYSLWASFTQDQGEKARKGGISSDYFSRAVQMSPQSARLWDEWALVYLNILQSPEEALTRLERSVEIDPEYHWTYAMMGDLNLRSSRLLDEPGESEKALQEAVKDYTKALELAPTNEAQSIFGYKLALASAYVQLGEFNEAIRVYGDILNTAPAGAEKWRIEEAIANLYLETGDIENALIHFKNGLSLAPDDQKSSIQEQIDQIPQSQP
jgi:tetratricopeptide (TPR) repeat protein